MDDQGPPDRGFSPRHVARVPQNAESKGDLPAPVPRSGLGQAHRENGRVQRDPDPGESVPKDFP